MENYPHSIAYALQLSGALLLLIAYWNSIQKIIDEKYSDNNLLFSSCQNPDSLTVPQKDCIEIAKKVILNRIAFIEITFGYLIDFIIKQNESSNKIICFLLSSVFFVTISLFLSIILSHHYCKNGIKITSYGKTFITPAENILKSHKS